MGMFIKISLDVGARTCSYRERRCRDDGKMEKRKRKYFVICAVGNKLLKK